MSRAAAPTAVALAHNAREVRCAQNRLALATEWAPDLHIRSPAHAGAGAQGFDFALGSGRKNASSGLGEQGIRQRRFEFANSRSKRHDGVFKIEHAADSLE